MDSFAELRQRYQEALQQMYCAEDALRVAQERVQLLRDDLRSACTHQFVRLPREPHDCVWIQCKHCGLQKMQ